MHVNEIETRKDLLCAENSTLLIIKSEIPFFILIKLRNQSRDVVVEVESGLRKSGVILKMFQYTLNPFDHVHEICAI